MKHGADKFDSWRLVGILFFKLHHESECSIFEGRICRANDDSVPECDQKGSREVNERADHVITLSAIGEAETPEGGSVCIRCDHKF